MLMPRFTIRTLLAVLTLCACGFVVIGTAYRGQFWAWGVTIALVTLIVTMLVHAALFGIVWLFSRMSVASAGPVVAQPLRRTAAAGGGADDSQSERSLTDQPSDD